MSHALNIHDGLGIIARDPGLGILLAYGSTVPGAVPGYAPGCEFLKTNGTTIGTVRYINTGTKASASFQLAGLTGAVSVNFVYGEAVPLDAPFFIADRAYTVRSVMCRPLVAGTDAGAVTAIVRRTSSGTAVASGSGLHFGAIDLKGTIEVNQVLTIAAAANIAVPSGAAIGLDVTGVTTAARGVVSVLLIPQ